MTDAKNDPPQKADQTPGSESNQQPTPMATLPQSAPAQPPITQEKELKLKQELEELTGELGRNLKRDLGQDLEQGLKKLKQELKKEQEQKPPPDPDPQKGYFDKGELIFKLSPDKARPLHELAHVIGSLCEQANRDLSKRAAAAANARVRELLFEAILEVQRGNSDIAATKTKEASAELRRYQNFATRNRMIYVPGACLGLIVACGLGAGLGFLVGAVSSKTSDPAMAMLHTLCGLTIAVFAAAGGIAGALMRVNLTPPEQDDAGAVLLNGLIRPVVSAAATIVLALALVPLTQLLGQWRGWTLPAFGSSGWEYLKYVAENWLPIAFLTGLIIDLAIWGLAKPSDEKSNASV